jgi:mannosyltransferase OCH1-like enzyme
MEQGGIYLDLDMLVLKPFDDLRRRYECTIGREIETKVCGSVVICSKNSLFLTLWINAYLDDYRVDEWAYNTGVVSHRCHIS